MPPYPGFEFAYPAFTGNQVPGCNRAASQNLGFSDNTITPQDAFDSQLWARFDELVSSPPYPPANETETRFYLDPSYTFASASPLSSPWSEFSDYQAGEPSFDLQEFSAQPQGYHMDPAADFAIGESSSSSSSFNSAPSPSDFSSTVYAPYPFLPSIQSQQPPPLFAPDAFQQFENPDRSVDDMLREEFFRLPADMQEEYFLSPQCRDLMMALFPRLTRLIASNQDTQHTTQWPSYDCYGTALAPTAAEDHALGRSGGASKRTRRFRGLGQNQTEDKKRWRARQESRKAIAPSGSSLREAEHAHNLRFNQPLRTGYGPSSRADPVERAETHPQRSSQSHGSTSRKTKAGRTSASGSRRSRPAPSGVADCLTWKPVNQYTIPSGPTPPIPFFDGRITKTTRTVGDHEVRIDRVDGRFLGVSVK
ncbi:hypothetical protein CVT26_007044 [Gymnopilus dilepis]|uniref:Uncharacterized protein n=1 Tax=Gymnopilus dilepis TaxID=231916 RepID=A0A409VZZ5_9AGAR|nr:hypothetical protein CVT26_007044 [Gymnopilus dilepis]